MNGAMRRLGRLAPHAAILLCNMYVVFYLIDRVNKAMNFIDNGLTKGLLLALCVISLLNARTLLKRPRTARCGTAARPAQGAPRRPANCSAPARGREAARR